MKVRILFLFFSLTCFAVVNAQTTVKCAFSTMPGDVTIAKMMPKTGTFKMLVVYCKFKDDTFESNLTKQWPCSLSTLPAWTSKTISATKMDDYPDPSISGYFKEMSGGMNDNDGDGLPDGKLDVIGNVCPILYNTLNNSSFYTTAQGRNVSYLTKEVLDGIDPYVNFADYDSDKDGYVDMIAICFRVGTAATGSMDPIGGNGGDYQGIASLTGGYDQFEDPSGPTELIKDGVKIKAGAFGSGTFQVGTLDPDGQLSIICHEMGHYLDLKHTPGVHRHGLMDTNWGGSVMNGYERNLLGWIRPVTISSDATVENGNPITLKDALGNNAIYKILKSDGCYYYIENHEGKSFYESSWKSNATESNLEELIMPGKGVLVLESSIDPFWLREVLDVKVADGLWNWKTSGSLYVYPFEIESPNPYSGQSELDLYQVKITTGEKKII
ncbi:MAG: hypothetical protein ACM3O3_06950 [Syntrophothermus sp.]